MTDDSIGPDELDAIEERAAAATPGPWLAVDYDGVHVLRSGGGPGSVIVMNDGLRTSTPANGSFIASARSDVPRLVARVRELEAAERGALDLANARWADLDAARAEAAQLRAELADLHPVLDATQAQLTQVGREAAQWKAKYEGLLIAISPDQEAHTAMVAERDEWKCHRARCAADLEKVKKERDEARRTIEAAGRYMQGLDEAIARAERAEAAAGQMRAALEEAIRVQTVPGIYRGTLRRMKDAIVTDAGRGWVSSEAHAAVVAELDGWKARAERAELLVREKTECIEIFAEAEEKLRAERDELLATIRRFEQGWHPDAEHLCITEACSERDEAIARADRAEAAAGQMRAALEAAASRQCEWYSMGCSHPAVADRKPWCEPCQAKAAIATDAGKGWVSPEANAAVVANQHWLQVELKSERRAARDATERAHMAERQLDEARAQVAALDVADGNCSADALRLLARVRVLEEVATASRLLADSMGLVNPLAPWGRLRDALVSALARLDALRAPGAGKEGL